MQRTLVLLVVGLTPALVGEHTPNIRRLAERGGQRPLRTVTPAVTCTVQSTFATGTPPDGHGCVANGWYFRDLSEIWFWRQSNKLVAGEKIWDAARRRDPGFTCAKLFWWYNMYADVEWSITPRPMYPADGRKIPDIYADPSDLRDELNETLGQFPLFRFWGPGADIVSSDWIARSAMHVRQTRDPTLTLVYLPHLDYGLQKLGPSDPGLALPLNQVDALCGQLIDQAERDGTRVIVLSEYGITDVSGPVYPNRALRQAGLIRVREEMGRELLDAGASDAFAVTDHQLAHIYVKDPERIAEVKALVEGLDGVEAVWDQAGKRANGLDHPRSGELVALSRADRWFAYYYWLDDARAPDYGRTVEIHRKPGFDPVELFVDPAITVPQLAIGWRLMKKALGFRTLMDVIPLDASLVKGSHGRPTDDAKAGPLLISSEPGLLPADEVPATAVKQIVLDHLFTP
ncbi:MAG: alkaline phosphatase family protein [Alphaproteobacteria bacterium]|nr:alkaline phosphatase family protein [Alphaproteobacteria bacterium]MDP6815844.1 alkaline phosphatase family protein [Alphaproteobacteria bacterium]